MIQYIRKKTLTRMQAATKSNDYTRLGNEWDQYSSGSKRFYLGNSRQMLGVCMADVDNKKVYADVSETTGFGSTILVPSASVSDGWDGSGSPSEFEEVAG